MSSLAFYGFTEDECLRHTDLWINYMLERSAKQEMDQYRLRQAGALKAAMLTGAAFNNPEAANELYEGMMGELVDPESESSDEHFLTNPNATTDPQIKSVLGVRTNDPDDEHLHAIAERMQQRHEQRQGTQGST